MLSSAESGSRVRVAITGIGMMTPCGSDRESSWRGMLTGHSAVRWLTESEHAARDCDISRTRMAGAPAILPNAVLYNSALSMDVMARLAAREAVHDSGLSVSSLDPHRSGVVVGTSKGSLGAWHRMWTDRFNRDALDSPHPAWRAGWPNSPALVVADDQQFRGPVLVPVAACATGLMAIMRGVDLIRDGQCDVVLAGSVDDSLSEILWSAYRRLGVLAKVQNCDPSQACRPFDRTRQGFLMGAGAAIIVLERWEHAVGRGHQIYGEWLSGGLLSDARALTQVAPDAAGLTRLIQDVLRRGDVQPRELDYINLHGTGTRDNDRYETLGIRQALGNAADGIPCSSLKGTIGHLLGGAGSVEFATMLLAMRDGIIPPTANLTHADPDCDLDYTPLMARRHDIEMGLKLSLGFGGHLVGGLVRNCRHVVPEPKESGKILSDLARRSAFDTRGRQIGPDRDDDATGPAYPDAH